MFSYIILTYIAGAVAFTPSNFEPSSTQNLTVAYGSTGALNGIVVAKADTALAPTLGTATKLTGTYTLMMVDPDVPSGNGSTVEFLHWMQAGFTSADSTTTIAGQTVFELLNTANTSALAAYIQPGPPAQVPFSHRYVQLLLNTTGIDTNATLAAAAASRGGFDAAGLVKAAGLTVVMGNSFNVTADELASASTSTNSTSSSSGSKSGNGGKGTKSGNGGSSSFSNSTSSGNTSSADGTKGSSNGTASSTDFSSGNNSTSSLDSTKDLNNSTSSTISGVGSVKAGGGASDTSSSTTSSLAASATTTGAGEANASSSATASSIAGERLGGASSLMAAVGLFAAALVLL